MLTLLGGGARNFRPTMVRGCRVWLASSLLAGFAEGDAVGWWSDRSGRSNHASQGVAIKRPLYRTGIRNGWPVVRFDGGDDVLEIGGAGVGVTGAFSLFVVFVGNGNSADAGVFGNAIVSHLQVTHHNQAMVYAYVGAGGNEVHYPAAAVWQMVTFTWDGTLGAGGMVVCQNGTQKSARASTVAPNNPADYRIGQANTFLQGDVAELALYNRLLTTVERKRVERYLGRKYALAVA